MVRRLWTPEEIAYLRKHWLTKPCADIAAHVGRSRVTVYQRARLLGLRKFPGRSPGRPDSGLLASPPTLCGEDEAPPCNRAAASAHEATVDAMRIALRAFCEAGLSRPDAERALAAIVRERVPGVRLRVAA